ncbi:MAG: VWA domain-containing protein [Verrucomicrobiia bacterium]
MNPFTFQQKRPWMRRGSALLTFVFLLPVVFLFVGLAIDFGTAYITSATLSKAVDAACLAGMRNHRQGTAQATAIAKAQFAANYGTPPWGAGPVTPDVTFSTGNDNNTVLTITATATINTYFIRLIPQWKTLQVNANAKATRANLIMAIALDRSYSMALSPPAGSGGAAVLPGGVADFVRNFENGVDKVGMCSFASHVVNNVPIRTDFQTSIINAVNAFVYWGATFTMGGLTNAYAMIVRVPTNDNENVIKACVLFTDGYANTCQNTFNVPAATLLNFGGTDVTNPGDPGWFSPTTGNEWTFAGTPPTMFPASYCSCSQAVTWQNVSRDAEYRCIQIANAMRANGIFVYCVGLSTSSGGVNKTFLQQVANDPALPGHVPTAYDGIALVATSTPQVHQMFDTVAATILLRLTQ